MKADFFALLEPAIAAGPGTTALVTPDGQKVSYAALATTVDAFTAATAEAGLRRGDRVTIDIDNYAVKLCLILALSRLGVMIVIGATTRAIIAEGIPVDAVISVDPPQQGTPRTIPFGQNWFDTDGGDEWRDHANGHLNPGDTAIVAASSGTTGTRKFMGFSVETFAARMAVYDQMTGDDRNRLTTVGADTVWGLSAVVADATLDLEHLRRSLVKKLGSTTPLRLEIVGALPFNEGGKIDRARLRTFFIARAK